MINLLFVVKCLNLLTKVNKDLFDTKKIQIMNFIIFLVILEFISQIDTEGFEFESV